MRRRRPVIGIVATTVIAAAGGGCGGHAAPREKRTGADAAAEARRLGLTYNVQQRLRRACARQQERLGAADAPCPVLVPAGRVEGVRTYELYFPGFGTGRRSYGIDLATLRSTLGPPYHWVVGGGERKYITRALDASARQRERVGDLIVRHHASDPSSGLNQGHVSVQWRRGPRAYFVSVHGARNERRAILMARAMASAANRVQSDSG